MENDKAVTFLRALRGAPLSVLIAIRIFPGPASLLQLAAATGYDQHTCARATQALEAMGYLQRAHYRGWQLTGSAQQLPLWTPNELDEIAPDGPALLAEPKRENCAFQPPAGLLDMADDDPPAELKRAFCAFQETDDEVAAPAGAPLAAGAELKRENCAFQPAGPALPGEDRAQLEDAGELKREKCAFQEEGAALKRVNCAFQPAPGGGSGSSLINTNTRESVVKPPLPPQQADERLADAGEVKRENCAFQPPEADLLQDLIDLTGCPRRRAEMVVRKARDAGYYTSWLHLQVLRWHAYIADGRGKSLQNPGYFVARKLEDGEACPFEEVRPEHDAQARQLAYDWDHEDEGAGRVTVH